MAEQQVHDLVWSAIDGEADEAAMARLKELVETQKPARDAYRNAISMDQSLRALFS